MFWPSLTLIKLWCPQKALEVWAWYFTRSKSVPKPVTVCYRGKVTSVEKTQSSTILVLPLRTTLSSWYSADQRYLKHFYLFRTSNFGVYNLLMITVFFLKLPMNRGKWLHKRPHSTTLDLLFWSPAPLIRERCLPRPPVDGWNLGQYWTLHVLPYTNIPMIKFNL